jgi:hypothetical protein
MVPIGRSGTGARGFGGAGFARRAFAMATATFSPRGALGDRAFGFGTPAPRAERCAAPDPSQGDLVQLMRQPAAAETPPARPANPVRDTSEPWIKLDNKDWF